MAAFRCSPIDYFSQPPNNIYRLNNIYRRDIMEHNFAARDETFVARPFSSVLLFSLRQSRSSRKACFRKWNHLRQG